MRILVVSNLYPPHHLGGYELGCQEAVEGLKARGHDVRVLTSDYGVRKAQTDGEIYRWLKLNANTPYFPKRAWILLDRDAQSTRIRKVVREFHGSRLSVEPVSVSVSVALWAERWALPTCFYVFDLWLSTWRKHGWYALWPPAPRRLALRQAIRALRFSLKALRVLAPAAPRLEHVHFASHYLKRATLAAGEDVADAKVIPWGIEIEKFPFKSKAGNGARLLCAGQIGPHKGIHTAVETLRILMRDHGRSDVTLTIVGGAILPDYVTELRTFVQRHRLEANIEFAGHVDRKNLAEIYRAHDILLFPSVVDEGLGLGILEAMSSGLAVVGTASGGSAEILVHEQTGLVFPREDAQACASQVLRLLQDSNLFERLRRNGRSMVVENFRLETTIDRIERSLQSLIAGGAG